MSKTKKKNLQNRFDDQEDDYDRGYYDDYRRHKKQKKVERALKTRDIDFLMEADDE